MQISLLTVQFKQFNTEIPQISTQNQEINLETRRFTVISI